MRKFLRLLALTAASLFASSQAGGQTVAVTGNLKTMFANNLSTQGKVCFSLVDGAGEQLVDPRVTGGIIVPTSNQCVFPDGTGLISTNIYANDQINPVGSHYSVQYLFNNSQVHGDSFTFLLADVTEDLNTKLPDTTFPIIPAPTGDTTYGRLDMLNGPFLNPVNAPGYKVGGVAASEKYLKGNGISFISSTGPAAGVGSCANQVVSATNSDAAPTCVSLIISSTLFANQGTTSTVLHGNAAGNPSFGVVVSADLAASLNLVTPNIGVATGTSLQTSRVSSSNLGSLIPGVPAFLDMSGGTGGTGGMVQSTNDASNVTGYSMWLTNNAYWDGTNWIQPRGVGTSSSGFAVSNHKSFSFNRAAAGGVNGNIITWTELANLDNTGTLTLANVARTAVGSQGTPAYSFTGDLTTGFYRSGAGQITASVAGAVGPTFKAGGIALGSNTQFYSLGGAGDTSVSWVAAGVVGIGTGTAASVAGTLRVGSINTVKWAANFAGADCGAKINAASTALAGPGEIWVDQICGTAWTTAPTTTSGQVIRIVQGGTYTSAGAISLGQTGGLVGPGCGGNLCAVVLQEATGANLPALVTFSNNQTFISGLELDGNKANNPTEGVGISINQHQHVRITNVLVQNFKSHGVDVRSTLAGDEATVPIIENSLILFNDGNGVNCLNTTDGFMGRAQFEQNGLSAQGTTNTVVNVSGTGVTWVSGPKWTTDSSLVGTFVKFNNINSNFIVASIASTTSMTLSSTGGTQTGVIIMWGGGFEAQDCPGWRYEHSDFGGNGDNGLLLHGTSTGRGSGQNMIVGNEWGGNRANDLEIVGFNGAYAAINQAIAGNVFLGSTISTANVFSDIFIVDGSGDSITGNVFRPSLRAFGVSFNESAASRLQNESMSGNTFVPTFGTANFQLNVANNGQNVKVFANAEGTTGPSTFGAGPGAIKFNGGFIAGTGLQAFRQASTCTTAAAVNAQCTSTQTLPVTMADTNYTIGGCGLTSVTNPLMIGWEGSKTTTNFQVILINPANSALAATGTIECTIIHD